ncbi:Putative endoglucanase type K Cellulase, Endo-1, 4-beta-glucanase [Chondrus crispus]|uniref:Putative endoglucanase type K Cellulase, Endo-1, 4-beta-glucanase n=1 Tax=Chondrus crispus TaxID=2769 RepID=R7QRG3_CHOCR|nr:Putative endoglucanase type K Cellulase, Endo-1, 4-beta-glucanase [Chondrus crispus]CDF40071.1 Putative endoglucanase type K Cellulase, Endo-1, 4-beta-glucanase [Chondrus crispus]|eukprot:XP_005710365.1 Putative endoglucanase type K Cellulase, Endo-1, 4-beta-glucanase [Chondrus crispus]
MDFDRVVYFLFATAIIALFSAAQAGSSVCSGTQGENEYRCVDWSFGSELMAFKQYQYKQQTGQDVLFGVGSYGAQNNLNIGKCYKFNLNPPTKPIIAQVTNWGAEISTNQFDMQMGGGGFGVWNACSGPTDKTASDNRPCNTNDYLDIAVRPQFVSGKSEWGRRCGGHIYRTGCRSLPKWPATLEYRPRPAGSSTNEPNLRTLCKRSFDWGARINNGNKQITGGQRVPCPQQFVEITNLKRRDDSRYEQMPRGTLTSTMDCCSPASAYPSVTMGNKLLPNRNRIRPCTRDGYTRV